MTLSIEEIRERIGKKSDGSYDMKEYYRGIDMSGGVIYVGLC